MLGKLGPWIDPATADWVSLCLLDEVQWSAVHYLGSFLKKRAHFFVRVSLVFKASLHLFLEYPNYPFSLPIEVLVSRGQAPFATIFLSSQPTPELRWNPNLPVAWRLPQAAHLYCTFILEGFTLTHMNLLTAIRKLFAEYYSVHSMWMEEVAVHTKMNPHHCKSGHLKK